MATKTKIDVIDVIQHGDAIVLPDPEKLPLDRAINVLQRKLEYDQQMVAIHEEVPGFLPDALNAFNQTLTARFGWTNNVPTPGFFGSNPPMMVGIEIEPGKMAQVPWGRFQLPGVDGYLETGVTEKDGRGILVIEGEIRRKNEELVNQIVESTKLYLREHSLYRGKGWGIRLFDDRGKPLPFPEPRWITPPESLLDELIFSDEVMEQVSTSIFTPITKTDRVRAEGVPLKRGVLLAGPYGTGKSMTSAATAVLARRHGWTFIAVDRPTELQHALKLARDYEPAIVFCEDIDRVVSGERSLSMDEILNVVDGVDSKNSELMIVLTTNHLDAIHKAMLRPGRLDAVIFVDPPDADAAARLMRLYGRGLIPEGEDLTAASKVLDGQKPSVIREVVERSKLAAIKRVADNEPLILSADALLESARTMTRHIAEMDEPKPDLRTPVEKAADSIATAHREVAQRQIEAGVALNTPILPVPMVADIYGDEEPF